MTNQVVNEILISMRIDLAPADEWEKCSESFGQQLKLSPDVSTRLHLGSGPGIFEVSLTLAQIFSHKRAIGVIKGNSPAFDVVMPWFLKEAYTVQATNLKTLPDAAAISTWIQGIKKETAYVLMVEDHPVTGELAPVDEIDKLLNEKKIFALRVSHAAHFVRPMEIRPYSLRLCAVDDLFAFSLAGKRLRLPPAFSDRVHWNAKNIEQRYAAQKTTENQAAVEAFEAQFPENRYFKTAKPRLFDRAVLTFEDLSGEALSSRVSKKLGLPEGSIETANLCRWNSTSLFRGWWDDAPTEAQLRGLLVVPASLCERVDFAKTVRALSEELRSAQTW